MVLLLLSGVVAVKAIWNVLVRAVASVVVVAGLLVMVIYVRVALWFRDLRRKVGEITR